MAKKQPFDLAHYIRNQNMPGQFGGAAAGQWGIPDPAGTARGRLAQFRRGLVGIGVAQNPVEQWAMGSKPGQEAAGIAAGMKAYTEKKQAAAAKYSERQTKNQLSRSQAAGGVDLEERRLSSLETQNRTGWSTQRTMDFMANGVPSSTGKYLQAGRSPAEQESYMETIQDKFDIVNDALWNAAIYSGMSQFTDIGSLEGVEYDTNPESPTYGEPIIENADDQKAYDDAVSAAAANPDSTAIEKFGRMQSYYYTWNTYHDEDWSSLSELASLGVSQRTEEGKAETLAYRAFVIQDMQNKGMPGSIINMALSTTTPMPLQNMIDFGFLKVGQVLSAEWARAYGYDLPKGVVSVKIVDDLTSDGTGGWVEGKGYPVLNANNEVIPGAYQSTQSFGLEQTYGPAPEEEVTDREKIAALGLPSLFGIPAPQPEEEVETTSTHGLLPNEFSSGETFVSSGEEFRSGRDWSQPQILSANEAKYYYEIDGELPSDFTMTAQEIDGKLTTLSQTLGGWTMNYTDGAITEWISPVDAKGEVHTFTTIEEVTAYEEQIQNEAALAFTTGGEVGALNNKLDTNTKWGDPNAIIWTGGFVPGVPVMGNLSTGDQLVLVSVPRTAPAPAPAPSQLPIGYGGSSTWEKGVVPTLPQQQYLAMPNTSQLGLVIPPTTPPTWTGSSVSVPNIPFGTDISVNASPIKDLAEVVINGSMTQVLSTGLDGFSKAGDVLAQYQGPMPYDDNNLPDFVVKIGEDYHVKWNSPAGKEHLISVYPERYLAITWSMGECPESDALLKNTLGFTDQEIVDWWKTKPFGFKEIDDTSYLGGVLETLRGMLSLPVTGPADLMCLLTDPFDRDPVGQARLRTYMVGSNPLTYVGEGFGGLINTVKTLEALTDYGLSAISHTTTPQGRVFITDFRKAIKDNGLLLVFNKKIQEDLNDYLPAWQNVAAEASIFLIPFGALRYFKMPGMLKLVRTGELKLVRSIATVEDLYAASAVRGWRVMGTGIKGRFVIFVKDAYGKEVATPLRNLAEADSFFKYGTPYRLRPARMRAIEKAILAPIKLIENWTDFAKLAKEHRWEVVFKGGAFKVSAIDKAVSSAARKVFVKIDQELIEINSIQEANNLLRDRAFRQRVASLPNSGNIRITIDGKEIPLFTMPTDLELLLDTLKNQPGRLGLGLAKLIQAKLQGQGRPKLSIDDIKKIADPELQGVMAELVREGKVSIDTIFRASNIVKIRCEAAAKEMTDLLKSQCNTKFIDSRKGLPLDAKGDVPAGQVELLASIPEELTIRVGNSGLYAGHDVAEMWKYFKFKNPEIPRWFSNIDELLRGLEELGLQEGIINKSFRRYRDLEAKGIYRSYFPRVITGQDTMAEVLLKSEEDFLKQRTFIDAVQGRDLGLHYGTLGKSIDAYIDTFYSKLVNKRHRAFINRSGLTIPEIWETAEGRTIMETARATAKKAGQVKIIDSVIRHIYGPAGKEIPAGGRMAWINENFPGLADRVRKLIYYSSDAARRDILHSLENRMRVRKLILQNEIRNIKVASKAERTSIMGKLYDDTVKLRTAEERIQEIIDSLSATGILTDANASYLKWFAEWAQKEYPGAFRWYKNWTAEPGASHLVTVKSFLDDVVDLRKSIADEISWFNGMTEIQRAARLSDPLAVMGRLEEANAILTKIWRTEKPGKTIEQLRTLLDGVFPGEFTGRLDDLVAIFDKSKVRGIYESLEADVRKLLDEAEKAKVAAAIDRKAAEAPLAKGATTHRFEDEGRTAATFDRVFGEIKVNGKTISGEAVRKKIEKIYTDKANPLLSAFAQVASSMLPLQLAMDFSFATIQGAPMLGLEAVLNFRALVNGESPSFIWAEAMKYSVGQTFSGMLGKSVMRTFRNKHIDVYDRKLGKGLVINDSSDFFASVGWIGKNIEKISNKNARRPLEWAIAPYAGFQSGFSAWSEVARVLLIEKLETSWYLSGGTEAELARFANSITGSLAEPGRGAMQRASETALFIAPRYYRANLFVLNRMLPKFKTGGTRGITGKMMAESIVGMYASFTAAYIALCYALGQSPKLDPRPKSMGGDGSEFLSLEIDGQFIGVPNPWFQGARAALSAAAIGLANPDKIFSIDWNNLKESSVGTLLSFATDRQSLALSFIEEMATGEAYGGIRLEDSNDYLKTIGEKFIPTAWRNLTESGDKPSTYLAWGMRILGLRNWRQNTWVDYAEAFNEFLSDVPDSYLVGDQLEKRDSGKLTMNDMMSWQIDKILLENPELKAKWDIADESFRKSESDMERSYNTDKERIDTETTVRNNNAGADLRDTTNTTGITNTKEYNDALKEISQDHAALSGDLHTRYPEFFAELEKQLSNKTGDAYNFDLAMNDYYDNVVNGAGNYDKYNNFIMENYQQAKQDWKDRWDPNGSTGFYSYLLEVKRYGLMDQDPLLLKMWEAKEELGAYWAVPEEDREAFLEDPDNVLYDADLIFTGYTSVIHNPDAEAIVRQWCAELGLNADAVIPALTKLIIPDIMLEKFADVDGDSLKPNDKRTWSSLPISGYAREWFLATNPAFRAYATSTEEIDGKRIGWLNGTDSMGRDKYTIERVPSPREEEQIAEYNRIVEENGANSKAGQYWRCANRGDNGEAALKKIGIQPISQEWCERNAAETSSFAQATQFTGGGSSLPDFER
jgi:hypothetical protein